ncbi:MAG: Flp pilus assembly complex ATPase component TadA [Oscillospiraceae bacterium]|jgi:type IV pilus assembly protein PilB|nr:Flp pilus assembly complex ATPase component TadA [Oscillospiraceae bacterium]
MITKKKLRLGDILVVQGLITEEQLQRCLDEQKKTHERLGRCLVSGGVITDKEIARALHVQLGVPLVELRGMRIPEEVVNLVSGAILRRHSVIPLGYDPEDSSALLLAMADPLDINAQDDISIITNLRVEPRIATESEIQAMLDRYFGSDEAMSAAEQYAKERETQTTAALVAAAAEDASLATSPMVQLVRSVIEQAVRLRASDIHIDALEKKVRIRFRVDGTLVEKMLYDINLLPAITARVKILGGMDISERRKPQDGRMSLTVDRRDYDIRISCLPSFFGEKIVLRLQQASGLTRTMNELGMREWEMGVFRRILSNPNGIILVTGPTGSGKSTTLYTALSALNREGVNIITVEDPVEASIAGINQVQVNPKAELTFATALRSILRQDPDSIMIGEIRDGETASIAVQASITGHLVVSTLHTNSSAATVTRLIDMGIEPFLLADSLVGVLAQRLIRRLCENCRTAHDATEEERRLLNVPPERELTLYEPAGCSLCGDTGYYGRIGVYEIMDVSPEIRRVISARGTTEQIRDIAISEGMHTLRKSASDYVLDGVTSLAEMLKVAFE